MKRLVIAIDCDDVLVDTAHDIIDFYNERHDKQLDETDFYADINPERFGVDTFEEAIERLMMAEHHAIRPKQATIEAVQRLAIQHELHLVTGRQQAMERVTASMVDTYFPGCFKTIEHTNYYTVDKHAKRRSKGEVCRGINADVMVDDYIEHIKNVIESGLPHAILFGDFDWGKRGPVPKNTTRCATWDDVEKEIERIAKI